jgi:Ca2+-binding EF-hand superfamily protein
LHPEMRPPVSKMTADKVKEYPLSPQEEAHFKEIFHLFDNNGDGTIDDDELPPAMFALGIQSQKSQNPTSARSLRRSLSSIRAGVGNQGDIHHIQPRLQRSLESADIVHESSTPTEDKCDVITLEKFIALMKGELTGRDPQEEIRTTFAAFSLWQQDGSCNSHIHDSGNSVFVARPITLEMLQRACKEFDVKLTDRELVYMIDEVDSDGNGWVEEAEYVRIMSLSPWF